MTTPTVHITGVLEPLILNTVLKQIKMLFQIGFRQIEFNINSNGGDALTARTVITEILQLKKQGLRINTHIVKAKSAAALFAMIADSRTADEDSVLHLHLGEARVQATDVSAAGHINPNLAKALAEAAKFYWEIIRDYLPLSSKDRTVLAARGELELRGPQLVEMKFVTLTGHEQMQLSLDQPLVPIH